MFPFDRPAAPAADGNQALAVNTTDGSVKYSVAFALVWADDGGPVTTNNEAYAFASCSGCAASQLVLTLNGPLDGDSKQQLEALWAQIAEYGRNIQNVPLSDIQSTLNGTRNRSRPCSGWAVRSRGGTRSGSDLHGHCPGGREHGRGQPTSSVDDATPAPTSGTGTGETLAATPSSSAG